VAITQTNQLTLDYVSRGRPYADFSTADTKSLDYVARGTPYVTEDLPSSSSSQSAREWPSFGLGLGLNNWMWQ
jgi:hypothetical protein